MIDSVGFYSLVTFYCICGKCVVSNEVVRVFIEKGLVVKSSRLIEGDGFTRVVECGEDECSEVESIFSVHYIYDPARDVEYIEWELVDGLLIARRKSGEWVKYKSKDESLCAMHEYVGGCWFVFSGMSFSRRVIYEYAPDHKRLNWEDRKGDRFMCARQSLVALGLTA